MQTLTVSLAFVISVLQNIDMHYFITKVDLSPIIGMYNIMGLIMAKEIMLYDYSGVVMGNPNYKTLYAQARLGLDVLLDRIVQDNEMAKSELKSARNDLVTLLADIS